MGHDRSGDQMKLNFLKSYTTDYDIFKKRYVERGLGNLMDAANSWRYLLSYDPYLKYKALKEIKESGMYINDLPSLNAILKSNL